MRSSPPGAPPPAFDPARGNASTWLLTLVHRRAVDLVRREERRRADVLDESAPVASGDSTDEAAEVRAQRRAVQAALAQLPPDQREALELAYYGGLSQSQLAERLGIPLGTVKSRMFTALATLRDLLGSQEPELTCCRSSTTSRPAVSRSSATR